MDEYQVLPTVEEVEVDREEGVKDMDVNYVHVEEENCKKDKEPELTTTNEPISFKISVEGVALINEIITAINSGEKFGVIDYHIAYHRLVSTFNKHITQA